MEWALARRSWSKEMDQVSGRRTSGVRETVDLIVEWLQLDS
jgi:hypothetical protein